MKTMWAIQDGVYKVHGEMLMWTVKDGVCQVHGPPAGVSGYVNTTLRFEHNEYTIRLEAGKNVIVRSGTDLLVWQYVKESEVKWNGVKDGV